MKQTSSLEETINEITRRHTCCQFGACEKITEGIVHVPKGTNGIKEGWQIIESMTISLHIRS